MQLQILIIFIFIQVVLTSSHETFTRSQLRSLYQKQMDKKLDEEIQGIIGRVIETAQKNETNYSFTYSYLWQTENTYLLGTKVMHKFEDKTIIDRLQNILVDSNITITEPRCCKYPDIKANENASNCIKYPDRMKTVCKFIHILWI
jgi:hypothetical protein